MTPQPRPAGNPRPVGATVVALALAALVLGSCTAHAPHRLDKEGRAVAMTVHEADFATKEARERIETSALEVHEDEGYELAFLEFDDQGSLFSRAPLELLIDTLKKEAARSDKPRLNLVLFTHGWLNDARLCNRNACCFRAFLSRLAKDVRAVEARAGGGGAPARTIGIFIGWRGLSATVPPLRELSFYARKRAAHTIGQGELVELLTFLDRYQKHVNEETPRRCRLVMLGHSFGGAAMFTAIANVLKSRVVDAQVHSMLTGKPEPVVGFGDLVVLANPAFEAALYAPFQELLTQHPTFGERQRPALVILASETDSDTKVLFKVGRSLSTMFQRTGPRSPRETLVTTVGNYDPFVTHRVDVIEHGPDAQKASMMGTVENCACALPMKDLPPDMLDRLAEMVDASNRGVPVPLPPLACPGVETMGSVALTCKTDNERPLWVVRASNEVISGHSGFFTRPVSDLLRGLVFRAMMEDLAGATRPAATAATP
jgi:pimeloyl-ACP methyl ester carboxylesterase